MGSIIHPWKLVMLLFVTSVAAMVHSADDMDVGSVTGDHPEPRGDDTNGLQRSAPVSKEHIKRYDDIYSLYGDFLPALTSVDNRPMIRRGNKKGRTGDFKICIIMAAEHDGGSSSNYYIKAQVLYDGGPDNWGSKETIGTTNVPARDEACYTLRNKQYYRSNKVHLGPIAIFNENPEFDWFPQCITIVDPRGRVYTCYWADQCCIRIGPPGTCQLDDCLITNATAEYISCERRQYIGCLAA